MKTLVALWFLLCVGVSDAAEYSVIRQYTHPIITGPARIDPGTPVNMSSGSAVVIAPGYALTAAHVVPTSDKDIMHLIVNDQTIRATPVKIDKVNDLALLSVRVTCPCAPLGTMIPALDEPVYSVGYPLYMMYGLQFVTPGTVQGRFRNDVVTTSITAPGGSGGGVFAKESNQYKLIGVTVAIGSTPLGPRVMNIEQEHNWITFSVPITTVRAFLRGTVAESLIAAQEGKKAP